jgi:archaemetzincin
MPMIIRRRLRAGGEDRFSGREKGFDVGELRIVPVNSVQPAMLARLALCLEERFLLSAHVERTLRIPPSAVNSARGQLFVNTVVSKTAAAHPGFGGLVLAVTDFDLYKTSQQFIFGDASEERGVAVVSTHRLRADFYGGGGDENVLFQRLLKEAVHEIGHLTGLRHCHSSRCAMYRSASIFDADAKLAHFCDNCEKRSRASR